LEGFEFLTKFYNENFFAFLGNFSLYFSPGWDTTVYTYADSNGGCTSASIYAYLGSVKNQCDTSVRPRVLNSQSHIYRILQSDAETIRQFLYDYGPLFVAFDVYNNLFSYRSGILTTTPGRRVGGHAGRKF
jgi:hypothetical protein